MGGWPGGWVALEEWKVRLTSAKVLVEVEAVLVKNRRLNDQGADILIKESDIFP